MNWYKISQNTNISPQVQREVEQLIDKLDLNYSVDVLSN